MRGKWTVEVAPRAEAARVARGLSLALPLAVTASAALGWAPAATADEGEIQITLAPGATVVNRHDAWRAGPAASLAGRYGVPNREWLAVECVLSWDQLGDLTREAGPRGTVVYGAQRMGATVGAVLRYGYNLVLTGGLGAGYRYESRERRAAVLVANDDSTLPTHRLVAAATTSLEWRLADRLSAAWFVAADLPAAPSAVDVRTGVALSVIFWPKLSDM